MKSNLLKTLFTGLTIFIVTIINAQNFEWAKPLGGSGDDRGWSIALDNDGNIYTTGRFQGTADFNPGTGTYNLTSAGNNDVFICKLDALGGLIWAKRFGGTSFDEGYSITVDINNNVYVTGSFAGTVDFDPGIGVFNLTSIGNYDVFICKFDSFGNFSWAKQLGGGAYEYGLSIKVDNNGFVYTAGKFQGLVDFDPGTSTFNLASAGGYDIYVSKLDSVGDFVWAKRWGGNDGDYGQSLSIDDNNNIYITGLFSDSVDFNPNSGFFTITSKGVADVFISKLDSSGNFIWAKQLGGSGNDQGYSIDLDNANNLYVTGYFNDTADFNPDTSIFNLVSYGGADIFIEKLDSSGNFLWAKQLGGSSTDYSWFIALDSSNNVYTTGHFSGTADFDPGFNSNNLISYGAADIFIEKLDSSGNFLWVKQLGGSGSDVGQSLVVDNNGNIYTTGYFNGISDFDPSSGVFNLTPKGNFDIFVHKMSQCMSIDTSVTNISPILISNATGATYQWLDCDNNYAVISGETGQSYTASSNGNYAVEVTQNSCVDTSACNNVTGVNINEEMFNNILVYPNPTDSKVKVQLSSYMLSINYSIQDITGRIMEQETITNKLLFEINMTDFSNGIYFIHLSSNEGNRIIKLIKEE